MLSVLVLAIEGHGEKMMIDRAEFEKWAKENGKIIINPQDKFMNTMKIIELMKEKNIIGTSFYIYKEKDLYHTIGFYVELTDVSLAIEELLYYKIYDSINIINTINKNKTKPQTGEIKSMLKHINSFC